MKIELFNAMVLFASYDDGGKKVPLLTGFKMNAVPEHLLPIKLQPGEIHIWFVFPNEIHDTDLISAYKQLMIPEEEEKYRRFRFPKHRHQYLVTRALARTMLSRYTGVDPTLLHFLKNRYGRPELVLSKEHSPVRFNLSHTDGLIACAVVLNQDIGIDAEDMKRREVSLGIADRFFSEKEANDLQKLPEENRRDRFYDYWTLKESYIKARGKGLSISLDQFTFHISDADPLRISFDPRLKDNPKHWRFWLLKPTDRHKAAISVFNQGKRENTLMIKKTIPLIEDRKLNCEILKS